MTESIESEFLSLLRCPRCVGTDESSDTGRLEQGGDDNAWLLCGGCGLQYPIEDGVPVLLIGEARSPDAKADQGT